MIKADEAIKAIKKLIFGENEVPTPTVEAPKEEEVKMAKDYKLADGSMINISDLSVGGIVMIGETVAPDANYTLEDGTEIAVMGGAITEVKTKEAETVEPVEAAAAPAPVNVPAVNFDAQFAAIEKRFELQNKIISQMVSLLEQVAKTEVAAPIEPTKKFDDMTKLEQFRMARKQMAN